jgi:hypothetical protein
MLSDLCQCPGWPLAGCRREQLKIATSPLDTAEPWVQQTLAAWTDSGADLVASVDGPEVGAAAVVHLLSLVLIYRAGTTSHLQGREAERGL